MAGRNLLDNTQPVANDNSAPSSKGRNLLGSEKSDKREQYDVGEIGKETGYGAIAGALAPEILQVGGAGVSMIPGGALLGVPMMEAGTALRGARLAGAAAGAMGNFIGETAGQTVEKTSGPGLKAETARVLGSVIGPEPFQFLGTKAGKAAGTLASSFLPGISKAKTFGDLLQEGGINTSNLSAEQIKFLEKKLEDIRGGQPSLEAQEEIANVLKSGAQKIVQKGEATAQSIESNARSQAEQILKQAQDRATKIRESARSSSPQMRQISEADAQAVLQQGQAAAQKIQQDSLKQVAELRSKAGKLKTRAQAGESESKKTLQEIGTPQLPTKVGESIRDAVNPVFEKLKEIRSSNADALKNEAFGTAIQKEQAGERVKDTEAFQDAETEIINALNNPETGLSNATVDTIRQQLTKVRNAINPKLENPKAEDISFEGLENLRRFLRDRAYGLPAEGFDAINQQQAGRLADSIEEIQKEFSPGFEKFLNKYAEDSKPLNAFKTKLGEAVVGKEDFDMGRFATDPATLGDKFFKSETGVKDLVNFLGGDASKAESIARSYVAGKLQNSSPTQVSDFLNKNQDWLTQFPALNQQIQKAAETMSRAEKFGAARTSLADALKTDINRLPIQAEQKSTQVLSKAGKEAEAAKQARIQLAAKGLKGEKKLASTVKQQGEKEAQKVTQEAEKSAEQVRAEAQNLANLITAGDTSGPARIRKLINSENDRELEETAKIILSSPEGREKFADAVRQVISKRAAQSFKGAINDWEYISNRLVSKGLLDPAEAKRIANKLQEAFVAPVSEKSKASFADRVIRQAIISSSGGNIKQDKE